MRNVQVYGTTVNSVTRIFFIAAVVSGLMLLPHQETVAQDVTMTVQDHRPVDEAARRLISQYGWRITYEDPRYEYAGDLTDRNINGYADKIPAGGNLSIHFQHPSPNNTLDDIKSVLELLLQEYAKNGTGGRFRLMQTGDVSHILPKDTRDRRGNWVPQSSILDVTITLPKSDRTGMQMLRAITNAVGAKSGFDIGIAKAPYNLMSQYSETFQADDEVARDVLLRALDDSNRRMTWFLEYEPVQHKYYLGIILLDIQKPLPENSVPRSVIK